MVDAPGRVGTLKLIEASRNSAGGTSRGFTRLVGDRISSWSYYTPLLLHLTLDRRSGTCLDAVWRLFCIILYGPRYSGMNLANCCVLVSEVTLFFSNTQSSSSNTVVSPF
jgi:hypothetical protein